MYLHIGEEEEVLITKIIGIFDIKTINYQKIKNKKIINPNIDIPKSIIVVEQNNNLITYISNISTTTLCKRWQEAFRK